MIVVSFVRIFISVKFCKMGGSLLISDWTICSNIDRKALKAYKTVLARRGIRAAANVFSQLWCPQPHSRCSRKSEINWRQGGVLRCECRQLWLMWWDVLTPCYKELKKQSSCFHLVHPGSLGKALRKTWYLKWLMQMSRILVVERKGRVGKGYAEETEDIE